MKYSPNWLQSRATHRILVTDLMDNPLPPGGGEGQFDHYRDYLIAVGGPRMRRALIRAGQRHAAQRPERVRASALHRQYRARR